MKDELLNQEQLAEIGRAVHAGESVFSSSIPSGQRMLQQLAPPPKVKEPEKPEAPKVDPKLVEARAEEKAAKEELAQIGDRLKYLESGARLASKRAGVDWDAIPSARSTPSAAEAKVLADAKQQADARLLARMREIQTRRLIDLKPELGVEALREKARKSLKEGR